MNIELEALSVAIDEAARALAEVEKNRIPPVLVELDARLSGYPETVS